MFGLAIAAGAIAIVLSNQKHSEQRALDQSEASSLDSEGLSVDLLGSNGIDVPTTASRVPSDPSSKEFLTLLVVDAISNEPVVGPRLTALILEEDYSVEATQVPGRLEAAFSVDHLRNGIPIEIQADGYALARAVLWSGEDTRTLRLNAAGSVRARVIDEQGNPVVGQRIRLVPPRLDQGAWEGDWQYFGGGRADPWELAKQALSEAQSNGIALDPHGVLQQMGWTPDHLLERTFRLGSRVARVSADICNAVRGQGFEQLTDADGLAYWSMLPLGQYQLGLPDGVPLAFNLRRASGLTPLPAASVPAAAPKLHSQLSSPFLVDREQLEIEIQMTGKTGVFGFVPSARPVVGTHVVVKVFSRTPRGATEGPAKQVADSVLAATESGFFEATGIPPGRKYVQAWWEESGNHYFVAGREFELLPGEFLDLGQLSPTTGSPLPVVVELSGDDPAVSSALDHFQSLEADPIFLDISSWSRGNTELPEVCELIPCQFEETMYIHGLQRDRVILGADWMDQTLQPALDAYIAPPEDSLLDEAEPPPFAIQFVLESLQEHSVSVDFSNAPEARSCDVRFYSLQSDVRRSVRVRNTGAIGTGTLRAEPGKYYYELKAMLRDGSSFGAWGVTDTSVSSSSHFILEPALRVEAYISDQSGSPIANRLISFGSQPPSAGSRIRYTHTARSNDDGMVVIEGLRPNSMYFGLKGGFFRTGSESPNGPIHIQGE